MGDFGGKADPADGYPMRQVTSLPGRPGQGGDPLPPERFQEEPWSTTDVPWGTSVEDLQSTPLAL